MSTTSIFVNPDNLNVGIGTQNPNSTFHIRANSNIPAIIVDQVGIGDIMDIRYANNRKII